MNERIQSIERAPITAFGRFMYYCLPYRKRIIQKNIAQVYGQHLSRGQVKQLIQAFYSHLGASIKETILLRLSSEAEIKAQVEVKGHEYLLEIAKQGKGVLILAAHLGSFEVAPIGGILNFKLFQGRFYFIRRTLSIQWLEHFLFRRYYQAGLQVIKKKNALQHVMDALSENHAVVFVLDQHASLVNRDGIAVEFFGKKAGTYRSLASCARYTGLPVVPASTYRLDNGKHVLEFHEPIPWQEYSSTQQSLYENTLKYNQALEAMILKHPEQWMWLHRRWKL